MNCIEFRRALMVDPDSRAPAVRAHAEECEVCAAFARRQAAFERSLADAARVDVPEGLASRVMLRQSLATGRERRAWWLGVSAVAASLVLTVGLVLGVSHYNSPMPVDTLVLDHVNNELHHLHEGQDIKLAQLNNVLRDAGAESRSEIGAVTYAGKCRFRDGYGAHFVVEGSHGPVTVLLMPGEHVNGRLNVQDSRFHGVVLPAGKGSMAIIGELGESLDAFERRLTRSIRFLT